MIVIVQWGSENRKKVNVSNLGNVYYSSYIEVCVPELVLNETRQDETGHHFPNWRYWENTTFFWSRCSIKSGKNPGNKRDETGLLSTVRESLE